MTLKERIEQKKQKPEPRREPEWMRRKREIGLPAKELTLS